MDKVDFKKTNKALYLPKAAPTIIEVPQMTFIMVDGSGDPNGQEYKRALELLFTLSYTIKMKGKEADGYYEYVVPPLEGLWWIDGGKFSFSNRDNWLWTSMIRQPEFVTQKAFAQAVDIAKKKSPQLDFSKVRLQTFCEGLCVQMLHTGPYADEPATIEKMRGFLAQNDYIDGVEQGKHHEIYLSDPRKTPPENLKTVIRHPIYKNV